MANHHAVKANGSMDKVKEGKGIGSSRGTLLLRQDEFRIDEQIDGVGVEIGTLPLPAIGSPLNCNTDLSIVPTLI